MNKASSRLSQVDINKILDELNSRNSDKNLIFNFIQIVGKFLTKNYVDDRTE